jgi:SAM-dependent methyltransferase
VSYDHLPEILFPVDKEIKENVGYDDLKLFICNSCKHIFQKETDSRLIERIYKQLYNYYPFKNAESFLSTYRLPFTSIFSLFFPEEVPKLNLLEIGCSSLEAMRPFFEKGFDCVGVDPSGEEGREKRLRTIKGSYERINFKKQFDVIVLRFVLEHIIDVDLFLSKLKKDLKEAGLVLIQVPNIANFIENENLCIGAHEHIHYFNKDSLEILMKNAGFETELIHAGQMPSIIGVFRKNERSHLGSLFSDFKSSLEVLRSDLANIVQKSNKICFYGVGLKLIWILYAAGIDFSGKSLQFIDDNKTVQGRYLPGYSSPVHGFDKKIVQDSDVVVLSLNSIYYNKIIPKLKFLSNSKQTRIIFNENGKWLTWRRLNK